MGREYRWEEFGEDLFAPGASYCTGQIVDILSLKRRVPTFTLDCTDDFHQVPELDDVIVEPPDEYLNRLRAPGKRTNIWWKVQNQLPSRRQPGQRLVDHFTSALVDKLGFTRCVSALQFYWSPESKWRWRCPEMPCTVLVQTHKCKSFWRTWQPTSGFVMAAFITKVLTTPETFPQETRWSGDH